MRDDEDPQARRYGPVIIFILVLALFAWAYALHTLGAK